MDSPIVMRGSSDEYGSWNTIWIGRRRRKPRTSAPPRVIVPSVSGDRPIAARARVDLPDPDSPTRPTTAPEGTTRLAPRTAVRPPRRDP